MDTTELIKFVKSCAEYHPDEIPEWFLEELEEEDEDMDDAYDSFRTRYGSDADTDTIREVCEEARRILKEENNNEN
jgi:hypothetical protein